MVKSLILCEGSQDVKFLSLFCKNFLKLNMKTINIKQLGNKSAFFKEESYTQIKQQIKNGMFEKILFILDSDFEKNDNVYGGYKNTEEKIKDMIKTLDIEDKSEYFISCDPDTQNGNLEHLILSTLPNTKKDCIKTLIDCIKDIDSDENKKIVITGYETIFKEAPYNFNHAHFEELKTKIMELAK